MKHNENREAVKYSAPEIRMAEFSVENGFASSETNIGPYSVEAPDYGQGETI